MQEIVETLRRETDIMGEITAASQEQTTRIKQIDEAIIQMDQLTQRNSAPVEASAASVSRYRDQQEGAIQPLPSRRGSIRP